MSRNPDPGVSIILPVYNAAATLPAALASIAGQTFTAWECLIIDDGSCDDSAARAAQQAAYDARFRLLRHAHGGIVAALNAGLAAARAPLIARMDADDTCAPQRLARQVALLNENPAIGVAACRVRHVSDGSVGAGFRAYVTWCNTILTPDDHARNRFVEAPLVHPTAMFRRSLVARYGGYDAAHVWPEDYELWLRWMAHGVRFAKVPDVLFDWYDRPTRLSRTDARYATMAFYACKTHYLVRGPLRGCRRVAVWGAGRAARQRAALLTQAGIQIACYIDVDPRKIGRCVASVPVLAPEMLSRVHDMPLLIYVANRGARDAIRAYLRGTRFNEGKNLWFVA
jgi:glycosyltransferase involved in cell wall biosynthesis